MTFALPTQPRPDWRSPILLEIGSPTQVAIRLRLGGVVLTPTAGSVSVYKGPHLAGGILHATVALTTGTTSTATIPTTSATAPEEGYDTLWAATVGGVVYSYSHPALVVGQIPVFLLDDEDLYREVSALHHTARLPPGQTNWGPQIEEASYDVLQYLTSAGRRPWLTINPVDLRAWHLAASLAKACNQIVSQDAYFSQQADFWRRKAESLAELCRLTYYTEPTVHRGQDPIHPGAAGRPRSL